MLTTLVIYEKVGHEVKKFINDDTNDKKDTSSVFFFIFS